MRFCYLVLALSLPSSGFGRPLKALIRSREAWEHGFEPQP